MPSMSFGCFLPMTQDSKAQSDPADNLLAELQPQGLFVYCHVMKGATQRSSIVQQLLQGQLKFEVLGVEIAK